MDIDTNPGTSEVVDGAAVHAFTAAGAALGLVALLAASEGEWAVACGWPGPALIVDGASGPMTRRLVAGRVLARFSGEDLDKIADYSTYVAVPAFMAVWGIAEVAATGRGFPENHAIQLIFILAAIHTVAPGLTARSESAGAES